MTIHIDIEYVTRLEDEKRYWLDNFKRLRDDKIKLLDENEKLQDEHNNLKDRLSHLSRTNTNLQNDLFSEQLLQDETDDYINRLKQQLFNAYLEIESDNVNIELSHYHIKKLLKLIDEHTLINPYTD